MKQHVRPMRILFADDETSIQELMRIELPRLGHEATVCPDGRTALAALDRTSYDCVIVDLDMPGVGGLDVIARVRETSADTETVIITGKSSLESAVTAVRQGVFDYLTKPCKLAEIQAVLERVRKKRELTSRMRALERRVRRAEGTSQLVGASPGLDRVRRVPDPLLAYVVLLVLLYFGSLVNIIINNNLFLNSLRTSTFKKSRAKQWSKTVEQNSRAKQ